MRTILAIFLLLPYFCLAQNDSIQHRKLDSQLELLVNRDSSFVQNIDITTGKLPLSELLRNVARSSGVNLSVRNVDNIPVSCNFTRARVVDLLRFLCIEYQLDMSISGNIASIFPAPPPPRHVADPEVFYNAADTTLFYNIQDERLVDVTKKITIFSGHNIIVPQSLYDLKISGYVRAMPFETAIYALASINNLVAERDVANNWTIYRESVDGKAGAIAPSYSRRRQFSQNELQVDSLGRITAHIVQGNIQDIILDLSEQLHLNYYFASPLNHTTGIYIDNTDIETLLSVLLRGSSYSYYCERGVYVFGAAQSDALISVSLLPLAFRSVAKVDEIIPQSLKKVVDVKLFSDLNSLILSGDRRDVVRVETFLRSIDKPVPMVTMEIIIADVQKSDIKEIGIGAGIGEKPTPTSGTLSPGIDMVFGADAINDLLQRIRGTVNLGKVTSNFYISLQALEENGVIKLQSTPKLSTLNGHQATLTSGETKYYKEVQSNFYGSQTPIHSESYTWKSVDANLSIKVTPYVSSDAHITLEIEFEQKEFTGREAENAPPATATRSFKSIVKVQNEEMVLLGGLDRNSFEKSAKGIPFLARIPVIKWLFGKSKRNVIDRTLNVFIKPTVVE